MLINKIKKGTVVFKESTEGNIIFIIRFGKFSGENTDSKHKSFLNEGSSFGFTSILLGTLRSMTITALEDSEVYCISTKSLETSLGLYFRAHILFSFFKTAVEASTFFNDLIPKHELKEVFYQFDLKTYKKGEIIYKKHLKNWKVIVVVEGQLVDENRNVVAERGTIFGDTFLDDCIGQKTLYAYPDLVVMKSNWDLIVKSLKLTNSDALDVLKQLQYLKKIPLFLHFSETKLMFMLRNMKKTTFEIGETIIKENTVGDKFFILTEGTVHVTKDNKELRRLEQGNWFGEINLLTSELRTATVKAVTDIKVLVLFKEIFIQILDEQTRQSLAKRINLLDEKITLEELYFNKTIDVGKYGGVALVHNIKEVYAVKFISIGKIARNPKLVDFFVNERTILKKIDHQFCMKMVKTLKDNRNVFFLMEFINGCTLERIVAENNCRELHIVQFYLANLVLAIEYLNRLDIAHRDIKPSNIMVDTNVFF